jgi:hypothetical protein
VALKAIGRYEEGLPGIYMTGCGPMDVRLLPVLHQMKLATDEARYLNGTDKARPGAV